MLGHLRFSDKVLRRDNSQDVFRSRILTRRGQPTAGLMRSMSPQGFTLLKTEKRGGSLKEKLLDIFGQQ